MYVIVCTQNYLPLISKFFKIFNWYFGLKKQIFPIIFCWFQPHNGQWYLICTGFSKVTESTSAQFPPCFLFICTDKVIKDTCPCCLLCITQARLYPQKLQSLASWRRWMANTESHYFLHVARFAKYHIYVCVGGHSSFLFRLELIFSDNTFSLQCKFESFGYWHTELSPCLCFKPSVNPFIIRGQIFNVSCKLIENW